MSLPQNISGPFERSSFLGATVRDFQVTAAWGNQSTYLNINLVEDPANNDYFLLQDGEPNYDGGQSVGTAYQFTYSGFTFGGILKSVDQNRSMDGYPTYKVTLVSPVEVLDAAQVILAGYVGPNSDIIFGGVAQSGSTFQVSNLLNVYGWAENGGQSFGRSQITDIGIPWVGDYGVLAGLEYLTNQPPQEATVNNFGSYINYKNNYYNLDLSNLPVPPSYYRIGGVVNMTLTDLIDRFMTDAGVYWMIKLTVNQNNPSGPHTISFITVPKYIQQPLGQIIQYINGQDYINESSHGQELRSDITQAFLVGGAINALQPIQNNGLTLNVLPFFGFDFNGNPIIGYKPDGTQYADDSLAMNLNASSIADIMGELGYGLSYPCSILELRCALGNYDTWAAFIQLNKPALAQQLQLYGAWDLTNAGNAITILDLINDDNIFASTLNNMFQTNHWPAVAQRLYEFVKGQADVYYGKKFVVILPFEVQIYIDPTTAAITLSNEICDAGYAPEGEQLLGLNFVNENFFLDQTGRFYPFVRYSFYSIFNSVAGQKVLSPNIAYLKGSSCVTQYNNNPQYAYIYSRCEQGEDGPVIQNGFMGGGSQIFFIPNGLGLSVPAMVVTVPDAVWAQADDITGSLTDLSAIMNTTVDNLQTIVATRSTSFDLVVHPPAYYPNGICVALKSNQFLYGPWGKYTANGKLNFEQDEGLVPWDYGGYDVLTQAAIAKLNQIATGNQVLERGNIVEAGIPTVSIGEQLTSEGPVLTSISCQIGFNNVESTYTLETFVNRVGAFTIENAELLRRTGKIYQQLRRTIRQLILNNIERANIMMANYAGFMYGTSYAVEQHTPHGALGGRLIPNNSTYTPASWTQTYQESLANLGLKSTDTFMSTACVGMEALIRPYTTDDSSTYLPILPKVDDNVNTNNLIIGGTGIYTLNPLQSGCDIQWLLTGDTYSSLKTSKPTVDYTKARSMALRGPVMICGWGYDLQGNPMPSYGAWNSGTNIVDFQTPLNECTNRFMPNYLQRNDQWPAAPLDIMYDKFRSVWASPGMIMEGTYSGGSYMTLYVNNEPTNEILQFQNFLGGTIPTGVNMQCGWNPLRKCWTVISVACTSND